MLHCGLHAINAILQNLRKTPYTSPELDAITREVHKKEVALCAEGLDTEPEVEGNYPLESLLVALKRQNLQGVYEKSQNSTRARHVIIPRDVVGFLLGTGSHYLALVRTRSTTKGPSRWELVDNGNVVSIHTVSPFSVIQELQPRAVLRVVYSR